MITVCAASRRLTLSNAIKGIYCAEVAQQPSGHAFINRYEQQQPFFPASSWVSQKSFSTSAVNAIDHYSTSHKSRSKKRSDSVLNDLTSGKAKADSKSERSTSPAGTKTAKSESKLELNTKPTPKSKHNRVNINFIETGNRKKSDGKSTGPPKMVKRHMWQVQKSALQKKFEEGWFPRKKLSPDTLDTIRHLNATKPEEWTTPALAEQFKVSPEAIRRILKSNWQASPEERQKRQERWIKRHDRIWSHMEELGLRPHIGEETSKVSDARKLGIDSAPSS